MKTGWSLGLAAALALTATVAMAQDALDEKDLEAARGGLQTPLGIEVGLGASVRTYVDGSLALETRLTWTENGAVSERVFESAAGKALDAPAGRPSDPVSIAPGTTVIHDLAANRIASVVLNTGADRTIRQETDVQLYLPQLPDLQQRIAAERIGQGLQALAPHASGLGR